MVNKASGRASTASGSDRAAELRNRSRSAGVEVLKTLITLSTAAVALFFGRLTSKDGQVLPVVERAVLLRLALVFGLAALAALAGATANFSFYYAGAKADEAKGDAHQKRKYIALKDRLNSLRRFCFVLAPLLFATGVVASAWVVGRGLFACALTNRCS